MQGLKSRDHEPPPQEEKVSLLVAKTKVPKNTSLKDPEKYFELKQRDKADERPAQRDPSPPAVEIAPGEERRKN